MSDSESMRAGTLVEPQTRIDADQVTALHQASMAILDDPGITCLNERAADLLDEAGCQVTPGPESGPRAWQVRFSDKVIHDALEKVPGRVVLGAREPSQRLVLDTEVPQVYFGTGSETNIFLRSELAEFARVDGDEKLTHPVFIPERGNLKRLCQAAKLCNGLDNVDFYIRNVNVQDEDIDDDNKDVNVFLAALSHMTRHVQAGLANVDKLDDVVELGRLVAGGAEQFERNPLLSFITCLVKSPLQMVDDTTEKLIEIASRGLPVVISSSPQGGSTAPILEEGMVAQINAEILAGMTLAQVVRPGTPVLYGAVPVRARLDTLHDLYGAPEFIHYNVDCVQMARHYGVPCYSTAGVGDAQVPGMQATVEKLFPYLGVAGSGAQYVHYAFGLLDKTNVFCPLQAVLDDAHIGIVRQILRRPGFDADSAQQAVGEVRKGMKSATRLYARHIRKAMRKGLVSPPYAFETSEPRDEVMIRAQQRLEELLAAAGDPLPAEKLSEIRDQVPGVLPADRFQA